MRHASFGDARMRHVSTPVASRTESRTESRIAIVGSTASGKSAVGMAVVEALRAAGRAAEIVSMDSMAVYRGMDIGTAKPSAVDQAGTPHHLIDVVLPDEEFAVGEFQRLALAAIAGIEGRGAVPVLVGGTGLYVDAVIDELTIPGQYPAVRAELELEACASLPLLYARLQLLDPLAASRMEPANDRRIVRALEVTIGAGRPFSSFGPGLAAAQSPGRYRMVGLALPRASLPARIQARFARQMADGFLAEAQALLDRYGDRLSRTAAQALGYRELWAHLRGAGSLEDAVGEATLRTRQFAVRQERWFRRDARICWLDGETRGPAGMAAEIVAGLA